MPTSPMIDLLRCPVTQQPLHLESGAQGRFFPMATIGAAVQLVGPTEQLLVTQDGATAYPVVEGVPILMEPERLSAQPGGSTGLDVSLPPFAEAYAEQALYTELAVRNVDAQVRRLRATFDRLSPTSFEQHPEQWHDGASTANAKTLAFRHFGSVDGCVVMQIGGVGLHALTLLHAGAEQAIVISPVLQELVQGARIAAALGLADRVMFVGGIAERLPLADGSVDRIFSGSSMHHTVTGKSFPEAARVLSAGGRFASIDVWRAGRIYDIGIRVFGKRHHNVHCRAFDAVRIEPALHSFTTASVTFHGAIARYALTLGERLGRQPTPARAQRITAWEDRLAGRMPKLASKLSSLVLVRGQM